MGTVHIVRRGECLSSIAHRYGFASWRSLYEHPDNAALRERRPDPNVLHPGDRVHIPDRTEGEASAPTERRHAFVTRRESVRLRLVLRNRWGDPLGGYAYRLSLPGGDVEGTTDDDGRLDVPVPPDVDGAVLVVRPAQADGEDGADGGHYTWRLRLGDLDPLDEVSGVQARLANLGFDPGPIDGIAGPRTRGALMDFQVKQGIRPTGEVCDATRKALGELHPA
jgi:hypothetical protein